MNKSINQKAKTNLIILSIVITIIFLVINIALFIINNNYLVNKVEEENEAFLQITTHIINENEVSVALEYIEHYTHINEVEIEVLDSNNNMIFSSKIAHLYTSRYSISTHKGEYTVFIDNTDSITVNRIETNTIYVNVSLLIIYFLVLGILIKMNNSNSKKINTDLQNVLNLIDETTPYDKEFFHKEFSLIYQTINNYLENIDLLTEQRQMYMKGLAHDIKTPLTIIYSYFERVLRNEVILDDEKKTAFESSKRINELLNDIIDGNKGNDTRMINIDNVLTEKVNDYKSVFDNKLIKIDYQSSNGILVNWNLKDLSRVLDNIISNAFYYSEENSVFTIRTLKTEKAIMEFVSKPVALDTTDLNNMFKKGYRGSESKDKNNYGKGLGLYLCKILLSSVNGEITVVQENGNVKFTIIL